MGDHGDDADSATAVDVPVSIRETLSPGDEDWFSLEIADSQRLTAHSEGDTDTRAALMLDGAVVAEDDNGGLDSNFLIEADVEPGTYVLRVRGATESTAGGYWLRAGFEGGTAPTGAPSIVGVRRGVGELEVTWNAVPASGDGGSPVTGYVAVATNSQGHSGSCTTGALDTSCVIPNLTPGLDYTVRVRARNAFGDGPDSPRRTTVPLAAEGARLFVAPGNVRATVDHANRSVLVFWNAIPDDAGRSDVTGYVVQAVAEGQEALECRTDANTFTCTLTGFEDGVAYALTAFAESSAGAGPDSPGIRITPVNAEDQSNLREEAYTVKVNSETAASMTDDDYDYFRIVVAQRGTLYVSSRGHVDTSGSLYSETSDIGSDCCDGQGVNFSLWAAVEPGTYFVEVWETASASSELSSGPYTLSVSFIADDHGDDRFGATLVDRDSETGGYLAHGDNDYYRIEIAQRGTLYLSTRGELATAWWLQSFFEDVDASSLDGPDANFSIYAVVGPDTAPYFIRVAARYSNTSNVGPYTLVSSFIGDDHGDTRATATVVDLNSETAGYLAHGDQDYFRFDVAERGTLSLSTQGDVDTNGSFHSDSVDYGSQGHGGQGRNFAFPTTVDPGTYYLLVWGGFNGPAGAYTLVSSFVVEATETGSDARPIRGHPEEVLPVE